MKKLIFSAFLFLGTFCQANSHTIENYSNISQEFLISDDNGAYLPDEHTSLNLTEDSKAYPCTCDVGYTGLPIVALVEHIPSHSTILQQYMLGPDMLYLRVSLEMCRTAKVQYVGKGMCTKNT